MPSRASKEHIYANALNQFRALGPKRLSLLRKQYSSFTSTWQKLDDRSLAAIGLRPETITEILTLKERINPALEAEKLNQYGITTILDSDEEYPAALTNIDTSPVILYTKGNTDLFNKLPQKGLAVVGARKVTPYGERAVDKLIPLISQAGLVVISGLAHGVDSLAHETSLEAEGQTIAVLGSGLGKIYPAGNRKLSERIVSSGGLLVTEYPVAESARPEYFPFRNRIISGLSLAVLIIEAEIRSGTLITASHALEQGKEVLAVPGSIFSSRSRGCHHLIQQGAKLIQTAEDVLEEFKINSQASIFKNLNNKERQILEYLSFPRTLDEIAKYLGDAREAQQLIGELSLKGMIKEEGGTVVRFKT